MLLRFTAQDKHFRDAYMLLKCTASISRLYKMNNELEAQLIIYNAADLQQSSGLHISENLQGNSFREASSSISLFFIPFVNERSPDHRALLILSLFFKQLTQITRNYLIASDGVIHSLALKRQLIQTRWPLYASIA